MAVVVFQLGGPDSLQAVEPFLFNLFSDPDIIDFPFARLARPTLARLISSHRARHVEEHYASIGGKSPIRELTEFQARALERSLREIHGLDARVIVAMRYWHPLTADAAEQVARGDFARLVLLPLYPQYSKTTTGSSLNEWRREWARAGKGPIPTSVVEDYHDQPAYLDAVVEKIKEGLCRFHNAASSADAVHLVFSAHGVPVRFTEAGDPYQEQIEATTRLVMTRGGWQNPHTLCYQSRVNPGKWLEPSLTETLHSLAAAGSMRLLVVPISFVTDHVETLAEIDIEARALAARLGIEQFELMPALNDSPAFIRALADLVLSTLSNTTSDNYQQRQCTAEPQRAQRQPRVGVRRLTSTFSA
ncbi:MAG: ferrochelatase [Acidobacteria bacterium]|nr:ferrochelatase [Acidobacteriota bacterium]